MGDIGLVTFFARQSRLDRNIRDRNVGENSSVLIAAPQYPAEPISLRVAYLLRHKLQNLCRTYLLLGRE
jgi:hypothetical protein